MALGTLGYSRNPQLLAAPFSLEDHSSNTGSSSHGHSELKKPRSFMNPLNYFKRAHRKARLDAEDRETQTTSKPPSSLPAFVSSPSGDSSFLNMDPSRNALRAVRGRDKKKSKIGAGSTDSSAVPPEFDLDLEHMEGIIDTSRLPNLSHSPLTSGFEPSGSGFRMDGHAPTPTSSLPPNLSGPVFSDPFISRSPSVRSRDSAQGHHRRALHTIAPAAVPPRPVSSSGAQGGIATWNVIPSWFSGDQPEPDVSSSDDEKAPSDTRKSRRGATISRTLQSQNVENRNYKFRVYRTNTEYHILTCSLSTTVAQLSGALNAIILGLEDREDHRLFLKERWGGSLRPLLLFRSSQNFINRTYACAG